jgi:predicted dehydrogenase
VIRIGIVGAGRVAGSHADAARAVDGVALRAVAEVDEARREAFLARYGSAGEMRAYADYRDLLSQDDIDLVIVTLPHWLHAEAAEAAAEAGKHVLLEKPMALSLAECDRIIDAARRSGVVLAVGQTHHFHTVPVEAKRLLDTGRFGRIIWGTELAYSPRRYGSNPEWFFDRAKGGGQLLANGVHYVDRLLWTIGGPTDAAATAAPVRARPVAVSAIVGTYFNRHEPRYQADDGAVLFIRFDTGQAATLHLTGHYQGMSRSGAEYVCERGMVRYDGREVQATNPDDPDDREYHTVTIDPARRTSGFAAQLADVAEAIRQGRRPAVPGEWGRLVMQVLFAAEESSRTGREVGLE